MKRTDIIAAAKAEIEAERADDAVSVAKQILRQIEDMETAIAELRKQLETLEV